MRAPSLTFSIGQKDKTNQKQQEPQPSHSSTSCHVVELLIILLQVPAGKIFDFSTERGGETKLGMCINCPNLIRTWKGQQQIAYNSIDYVELYISLLLFLWSRRRYPPRDGLRLTAKFRGLLCVPFLSQESVCMLKSTVVAVRSLGKQPVSPSVDYYCCL